MAGGYMKGVSLSEEKKNTTGVSVFEPSLQYSFGAQLTTFGIAVYAEQA